MTGVPLDGLPLNRARYLDTGLQGVWLRQNTDPDSRGEARRTGSQRLHNQRYLGVGLTSFAGLNSFLLLSDGLQATAETVFTGAAWTVHFHCLAGALGAQSDGNKDFLLFRWGGQTGETGAVECYLRTTTSGTTQVIVEMSYVGGTASLSHTFASEPGPTTYFTVGITADATDVYLFVDETQEATAALASGLRTVSSPHWGEVTMLGKTARAPAFLSGNDEATGLRPSVTDLTIWDKVVDLAGSPEVAKNSRYTAGSNANLKIHLPLKDGEDGETAESVTGHPQRAFLCPGPPVRDTTDTQYDGSTFTGVSGHIRLPYNAVLDPLFTRRTTVSGGPAWALDIFMTTPDVLEFPDGDATICTIGKDGALLRFEIAESGGNHNFKATLGHLKGTTTVTSTKNLSAANRYRVAVSRETGTNGKLYVVVMDVESPSTTATSSAAIGTDFGPEIDEGDRPEVIFGASFNTTTEVWEERFRGILKHAILWKGALPLRMWQSGAHALIQDDAYFALNFKREPGLAVADNGSHGFVALHENDDTSGNEGSPPHWARGPINDGEVVAAFNNIVLTEIMVITPDGTTIANPISLSEKVLGSQRAIFSTDATGVKMGRRHVIVSKNRAHVVDEFSKKLRPLGLPQYTTRPGIVDSGPGGIEGVVQYGISPRSRDGTEGPVRRLPPVVLRGSTVVLGGGTDTPGAKYGNSTDSTGFWGLEDAYAASAFANMDDGTYTLEGKFRMDPDLLSEDFRERVFDRGVQGDSAFTSFWAQENKISPGDIDPKEPFAAQIAFRPFALPGVGNESVFFAITPGGSAVAGSDPTTPVVLTYDENGAVVLYVSDGQKITNGWTRQAFTTTLSAGTDYNIVLVFDGDDWTLFINNTKDATTLSGQGPPAYNNSDLQHLAIGGSKPASESYITGTGTKQKASDQNIYYMLRFWQRPLPDTDIGSTEYVWFQEGRDDRLGEGLMRSYRFATDDPFGQTRRYRDALTAEDIAWNQDNNGKAAKPDQVWRVDNKSARFLTFHTATPDTPFSSPLQLLYSRIGNGSLICTSSDNLLYYAANKAMPSMALSQPLTPLPPDGQTWHWYTFTITMSDSASSPKLTASEFWVDGERLYSGGISVTRSTASDETADLAGWGDYASVTGAAAVDVHLSEFRGWDSDKYDKPADFEWLFRRVPDHLYSELVYYYHMQAVDDTNLGTSGNGDALDGQGNAAITTVAILPLPTPPSPDIAASVIHRTSSITVNDFDDNDELDQAKRIAWGEPLLRIGEAPNGTTNFVDGTPDEGLGAVVANEEEGYAPVHVTGCSTWGGHLVLWGTPALRLYVSDRLDFETFRPEGYIDVETRDFEEVTAAIEAGDAFYVFGRTGGVIYRSGRPTRAIPSPIGSAVGAATARCVAAHGGICYVYGSSGLFAVGPNGQTEDIARANAQSGRGDVHDLLPTATAARLQIIDDSLYLIDESDGSALRLHLPTQRWSKETRRIRGGMSRGGNVYWAHTSGFLALGETGYADDVLSTQSTVSGNVSSGTSTTLTASGTPFPTGGDGALNQWVRLIRADNSTETRQITSNTSSVLTVAAWTGAAPTSGDTWTIGEYDVIHDTGFFRGGPSETKLTVPALVRSTGTWQWAYQGTSDPNAPDTAPGDTTFKTFTATDTFEVDEANVFHRLYLRQFTPEASELIGLFVDAEEVQEDIKIAADAS